MVTAAKLFFSPWTGCDKEKKNLVRNVKETERVRRALLSCAGWPVSFEAFGGHGVPVEVSFLSFVPPCGVGSFERICNAFI